MYVIFFQEEISDCNTLLLKTLSGSLMRLKWILNASRFHPPHDIVPTSTVLPPLSLQLTMFPTMLASFPCFTKPSLVPAPGLPHLLPWPSQVQPWPVPSCDSASSSDVTFSETSSLAEVRQPSPVTCASHCPVFQVYFLFSTYCCLEKKTYLFIFYSLSFLSKIEAPWGQGPCLSFLWCIHST